ncbi:MAG: N-acetyltransferase [Flavobacteriales bacterium]|nr:N-acetyltransferase [Flavobacteriales bacterium]
MPTKKQPAPIDLAKLPLSDDTEARRVAVQVGQHRARMEYDRSSDRIFLTLLDMPKALEEQGLVPPFIEKVLEWVESNKWKLVPTDPRVKDYLRKHPSWQRLLVKGVQLR